MSDIVIKVENLSKQYRLGNVGLGTLSHDVNRWYQTTIRRREDPYLKIGEANDRSVKGVSEYVWALRDINFEVKQGEVLGIIGRNGAGKSTLLKILSRTTSPTTGQIKIKGRVASLLEVGTGFHPELTGRENIFLNGAILGMTKQEIKSKFDEIVDFAGVERYIDTPVKRYSSGMLVRLAFAVAAHLEPEILIVDEVLAVGDAEFQKKALGKMKEVSGKEGRTVLFVSHNMAAVTNLCDSGMLLKNGKITIISDIENTIRQYQLANQENSIDLTNYNNRKGSGDCRVSRIDILTENNVQSSVQKLGEKISFELTIKNFTENILKGIRIIIGVYNLNDEGYLRFDTNTTNTLINISSENTKVVCKLNEHLNIKPDLYSMNIAIFKDDQMLDYVQGASKFSIENYDYYGTGKTIQDPELSKVFYKHTWENL
ncbi:MAG TPA: ABC transporter ATP-binding protein [Hanamia sp.]